MRELVFVIGYRENGIIRIHIFFINLSYVSFKCALIYMDNVLCYIWKIDFKFQFIYSHLILKWHMFQMSYYISYSLIYEQCVCPFFLFCLVSPDQWELVPYFWQWSLTFSHFSSVKTMFELNFDQYFDSEILHRIHWTWFRYRMAWLSFWFVPFDTAALFAAKFVSLSLFLYFVQSLVLSLSLSFISLLPYLVALMAANMPTQERFLI